MHCCIYVHIRAGILLGLVVSCVTLSFAQTLTTKVFRLRSDGRTIQVSTSPTPPLFARAHTRSPLFSPILPRRVK